MIPVMGFLIAGDWKSYQYLVESIRLFPNQVIHIRLPIIMMLFIHDYDFFFKDDFANLISDCGFKLVSYKNLTNGVVAIHSGFKF